MADFTPRRIASLQPSATVILDTIGELNRVVACTKYCADVVPSLQSPPRIILSDSWSADADQIAAVHPDLVIASVPYQEKAVIEILKSGARFLGFAPRTLEDIYVDIAAIAGIVGANARGKEVIRHMQRRIQDFCDRTKSISRPKVFCEEWGKPMITSQRWVAELVDAAGGEFIAEPGKQISSDEVAKLNPEVVIAAWCGAGDRVPLEKIVTDRGWQRTAAAKKCRVYCIRDEYLNTPAPTLLLGLEALAFAIHPELFLCPEGIRQITAVPSSIPADRAL